MRHAAGRYCYNSEYNPGIFQIKFQGWRSYVFLRQKGSRNMWYVIQTVTGKEEELMLFIRNILCRERGVDAKLAKLTKICGVVFFVVTLVVCVLSARL